MVDILKKKLEMEFDDAVKHVEQIVSNEGFNVMQIKAIDEIFKQKLNAVDFPRYTTIMACNPKLAKGAMDASIDMGLLFPCSFCVYEEKKTGDVMVAHVSIMKIGVEVGLVTKDKMTDVLLATSEAVLRAWNQF